MTESSAAGFAHLSAQAEDDEPLVRTRVRSRFHLGMATALLATVLVGFAPTLYLRALFDAPAIGPGVWLHAGFLTAWFVAFWLQTALIAHRRVAWHQRAGWLVAAIGLGALATSVHVTLAAVAAGTIMPRTVWSNFANAAAFAGFLGGAVALRRDAETHKRLMLLASIAFLQPAVARLFIWSPLATLGIGPLVGALTVSLLFLLLLVVHDVKTRKRLHTATLMGGVLLVAIRLAAVFVVATSSLGQAALRWFA